MKMAKNAVIALGICERAAELYAFKQLTLGCRVAVQPAKDEGNFLWHAKISSIRVKDGGRSNSRRSEEITAAVWVKLVWFFTGEDAEKLDVYKNDVADWWESFLFRLARRIHIDRTGTWAI